jgi:hypothetical protein
MDYWTRLNVEESSRVAKTNWRAKEGKKNTHTHKANERTNALGGTRKKKWRESWRTRRARLFDSLKRGGQVYANFVFLVCECVCVCVCETSIHRERTRKIKIQQQQQQQPMGK